MGSTEPQKRAIFFSGEPKSIGHIYRVEHPVVALRRMGWTAKWASLEDSASINEIDAADLVVVFRARLDPHYREIRSRCSLRRVPLVYDTDDLIFDPDLASRGKIALFDVLGEEERLAWARRVTSYRDAIALADHVTVSTEPLAEAACRVVRSVSVLPNVLGPEMWEWAAAAKQDPPSNDDGAVRLIFASGTPTHHRDFRVAAKAIARVLENQTGVSLTILGPLELERFPELAVFASRIEKRPRVPFASLFTELARAHINLCPLEPDNLFCNAKSAVRCLTASALALPSIVSPTQPLREAVGNGEAGLVAHSPMEWESALQRLITDPEFRTETGRRAKALALDLSDFATWCVRADGTLRDVLARNEA